MASYLALFVNVWLNFTFLFTPFFVLSMFLSMTKGYSVGERRRLAVRVGVAVGVLCVGIFFFGNVVFKLFGITLDSFRVGAGVLLFMSSIQLVQPRPETVVQGVSGDEDIAVVPLAIPIVIGPAIIGTLLILGADLSGLASKAVGIAALLFAAATIGCVLWMSAFIERMLGKRNIAIMSRFTGLILAALAAQMIMTGVKNFFS